jgi:hypothetical protein
LNAGDSKHLPWIKWKSLCSPASLPLTTDYFPSSEELAELYQEYTYTVSLNDEDSVADKDPLVRTETLWLELIAQRLAQGFQLVVAKDLNSIPRTAGNPVLF